MNAIPSATYTMETTYVWPMSSSGVPRSIIAHVCGQRPAPHPGPLEKSRDGLKIYPADFTHPPKTVTALLEEVHVNGGVVHQVLSDSRKVYQGSDIMECQLGGWSDTRQHQDLRADVSLTRLKSKWHLREVCELLRHWGRNQHD